MKLIGRRKEQEVLKELLHSEQAEFLAVYGRRRIGKTFLIREFFSSQKVLFFNVTGSKDINLQEQVKHFTKELSTVFYNGASIMPGKNWEDAFEELTKAINNISKKTKIVLFFDELPWMATKNSQLLQRLDYYWNQHWSRDKRIKLIICGSSASWIVDKIINNKGGLHNRITHKIHLMPFNLLETKIFLDSLGCRYTQNQILQIYMVMGGVPFYLSKIKKGKSAAQNIDLLSFTEGGLFVTEFDNLFSSLFDNSELCIELIMQIAKSRSGISQEDLFKKIEKNIKGKSGIQKLKELESSGFIAKFKPYSHTRKGIYYKVIDEYTLFYLEWIRSIRDELVPNVDMSKYWENVLGSPKYYNWSGYAFESIIYKHLGQVRVALGLDVSALPSSWRYSGKKQNGAQIDLLFDRKDDAISICEIKHTTQPFVIDKAYAQNLQNKVEVFKEITRTKKQIFVSIISASGLKESQYSKDLVDHVVTSGDLFV